MATRADITLKPAAGLTPEKAREARARAWAYIIDCYAKKKVVTSEEKACAFTGRREREEGEK